MAGFLKKPEAAIESEFKRHGTQKDKDNFRKVRDGLFEDGRTLNGLLQHPNAKLAKGLGRHHILALRLYTTRSYKRINEPMRENPPQKPHPFAATTYFITEGIKLLQAVHGSGTEEFTLWRGVAGRGLDEAFFKHGGTEFACMSTTLDKAAAFKFSGEMEGGVRVWKRPLLLKFTTSNPLALGADIAFLSVFQAEQEFLYPPLTYIRSDPARPPRMEEYEYNGITVQVAELLYRTCVDTTPHPPAPHRHQICDLFPLSAALAALNANQSQSPV